MLEPEGDVVADRAPGKEGEILEHEGDRVERVLRRRTLDRDRAGGRPQETADDRQKRALAATRWADDDRDLVAGANETLSRTGGPPKSWLTPSTRRRIVSRAAARTRCRRCPSR